ncbi:MAG: exodeoxyribonuclease III [Halieaceae bacterium]|jgi:exodeoxyribonuclease-3|nr:exodeoxyribonuclease III [Halieaceae bacterium]
MRVISFCADGLREAAGRGFYDWLARQDADFICVQDLRCTEYDLQEDLYFPSEYNAYFFDDVNGKANGVAIYCRGLPKAIMTGLGFVDFDMQGRYIQADYQDLSIGCILPPAADEPDGERQQAEFFHLLGAHLQKIRNKRRDYIICGNWQLTPDGPGLGSEKARALQSEWIGEVFGSGYADAFREVSATDPAPTFWPEGSDSAGLRSDLQLISENLVDCVEHAAVYTGERFSSHAPLIIDYDLDT